MSVGPYAEKFNTVSNYYINTHKCDFSVSDQKYPFWENLVKKNQNVSLSWNIPRLILGKFGPKNQNCQFKPKLRTKADSNTENSLLAFILFILDWKYLF